MEQSPQPEGVNHRNGVHVLVVPYPVQGHVAPLVKLAGCFARHGITATLVVTGDVRARIVDRTAGDAAEGQCRLKFAVFPDGQELQGGSLDERRVGASVSKDTSVHVKSLIRKANELGGECRITCLVADAVFEWAPEIAGQTGVELALFWPSSPAALAVTLQIRHLIQAGLVDSEGTPVRADKIQPFTGMPTMSTNEFPWCSPTDHAFQKIVFEYFCVVERIARIPKWLLCNCFHDLNASAYDVIPNLVQVGPLLANGQSVGTMKSEDSTCLSWLDQQPARSVVYVAFGSMLKISQHQLSELALGLELAGHQFLLVVRSGLTNDPCADFPDGFTDRVASRGKIVEWAAQERVLAHPSVACFLTHCGWNSTIEGISMGVPFLCWPCFADQLYNRTCICDAWKVGLSLDMDDSCEIISRHEIKAKIDELLSRADIRENSIVLKEIARRCIMKGGSSFKSVENFIAQIKG
ncbi:hypothetical protein Nepgr_033396 [Nepenthes gracilis]|uniref:Glycosyltransferase n=1 Tax=Nepenthes gracilis TaxID=150966 RepID=A0AAD3TLC5_NEPGR|nr:hypothetical protein Nepgr_033396 [Nepenthes gracilis]